MGEAIISRKGVDTSDATMVASDILLNKVGYNKDGRIVGSIPSKASATITPSTTNQIITAGQYLSGDQTILGDADLLRGNIIRGKNIFGVEGNALRQSGGSSTATNDVTATLTLLSGGTITCPTIVADAGFTASKLFLTGNSTTGILYYVLLNTGEYGLELYSNFVIKGIFGAVNITSGANLQTYMTSTTTYPNFNAIPVYPNTSGIYYHMYIIE